MSSCWHCCIFFQMKLQWEMALSYTWSPKHILQNGVGENNVFILKWIGKTHKLKACFRSATLKTTIKQTGLHVSTKPGHTLSIFSFYVGYRWKIDGIDLRSTACHAHWGRKSVDIVNVGFGFLWRRFPLQVSRRKSMAAPGLLHKTIEMIMSNDGVKTRQSHFTTI